MIHPCNGSRSYYRAFHLNRLHVAVGRAYKLRVGGLDFNYPDRNLGIKGTALAHAHIERGAPSLGPRFNAEVGLRGVMIPRLESILESDFEHFSLFDDFDFNSNSNSNSSKNQFVYCTGIDSGYCNQFQNLIFCDGCDSYSDSDSRKNGIITPLIGLRGAAQVKSTRRNKHVPSLRKWHNQISISAVYVICHLMANLHFYEQTQARIFVSLEICRPVPVHYV